MTKKSKQVKVAELVDKLKIKLAEQINNQEMSLYELLDYKIERVICLLEENNKLQREQNKLFKSFLEAL